MLRNILSIHPTLVTGSRKPNNADSFVIAVAKIYNCVLVTNEKGSGGDD
jgi:hypothetical protein